MNQYAVRAIMFADWPLFDPAPMVDSAVPRTRLLRGRPSVRRGGSIRSYTFHPKDGVKVTAFDEEGIDTVGGVIFGMVGSRRLGTMDLDLGNVSGGITIEVEFQTESFANSQRCMEVILGQFDSDDALLSIDAQFDEAPTVLADVKGIESHVCIVTLRGGGLPDPIFDYAGTGRDYASDFRAYLAALDMSIPAQRQECSEIQELLR